MYNQMRKGLQNEDEDEDDDDEDQGCTVEEVIDEKPAAAK